MSPSKVPDRATLEAVLKRRDPFEESRRGFAIAGLALWLLLGLAPLVMPIVWLLREDTIHARVVEIVLRFLIPSAIQTASAACAIRVLLAEDPGHAKRWSSRQLLLFAAGLAMLLTSAAAFSTTGSGTRLPDPSVRPASPSTTV